MVMALVKSMQQNMQFVLLLVGLLLLAVSANESSEDPVTTEENRYFTNIDFVGRGYDIYTGNPQSEFVDPGFRKPVFETGIYDKQRTTTDRRFFVPDGIDAFTQISCNTQFSSQIISDNQTFTDSLMLGIGGDLTLFGAPFSANLDFQRQVEEITKKNCVFLQSISSCEKYYARLLLYDPPPFTSNFLKAVESLPPQYTEETKKAYMKFLRTFGTHVVVEVAMGARLVINYQFSSTAYSRLLGNSFNMKVIASAISDRLLGGTINPTVSNVDVKEFLNSRMSMSIMSTGSRTPPKNDIDGWLKSDFHEPAPVRYEFGLISDFVKKEIRPEVESALRDFCKERFGANCNKTRALHRPVALCTNPVFSEQWRQTLGCSFNSFSIDKRISCPNGEALTAMRVARKRFDFFATNDQFIDIGCAKMTRDYELPNAERWVPPQAKSNNSYIGCSQHEFVIGISFMHKCLQLKASQELVSVQCRRSSVTFGECLFTQWVQRVKRRPRWTDVNCPLGYVARGIEYMYRGASESLDSQSVRFRCCKAPLPCVHSLPLIGDKSPKPRKYN